MNRSRQNRNIAVFGSIGSFTEQAAISKFGSFNTNYKYFESIFQLLEYLKDNSDYIGVIPFSNSNVGHVEVTQSLLHNYSYVVMDKIKLNIDLYLLAKTNLKLEDIEGVVSHPHALLQCSGFIAKNLQNASVISADSTSHAAMYLSHNRYNSNYAVVASRGAGEKYGLTEISKKIQDKDNNFTEFLVIKINKD